MADAIPQLTPRNLTEALEFCDRLAKTSFVPDTYKNKPGEILAAIQYGAELGIGPMQALQGIAVINGRPSLWGDVMLALVQASGLLEYINETETSDTATCEVKRKGDKHVCKVVWSHQDTVRAGLDKKAGPHQQYPKRMRQMRARGFALRNKFADVLKGIIAREEAQDIPIDTSATLLPEPSTGAAPDNLPPHNSLKLTPDTSAGRDGTDLPKPVTPGIDQQPISDAEIDELGKQWRSLHNGRMTGASEWLLRTFKVEDFAELRMDQVEECARLMQGAA